MTKYFFSIQRKNVSLHIKENKKMKENLFYNKTSEFLGQTEIIERIKNYSYSNECQMYLLSAPLIGDYSYEYENEVIVIASLKHKLIFLHLGDDEDKFVEYYENFTEDIGSLADKYGYKDFIGRPRQWKPLLTSKENYKGQDIEEIFKKNKLETSLYRKNEWLISLLIGSIDKISDKGVEEPTTVLDKVKKNIVLFDGEQTRFIYQDFPAQKMVSIQGLSGTGKTELLLHKLKEIYTKDLGSSIFFTCHNVALANKLKSRVPVFFDMMKVDKQIEWNKRLWIDRAWGNSNNPDSGLYSYLCNHFKIPFISWSPVVNYSKIFGQILDSIKDLEEKSVFDYIIVDEQQDFPKEFFEVCEQIARKKVYVAGDIFQDIFSIVQDRTMKVDVVLNSCYRTDPRTLMFAHALGLGLFESKKYNWFEDEEWKKMGYDVNRSEGKMQLKRYPVKRFEDQSIENNESVRILQYTSVNDIIRIIQELKKNNETIKPSDVAIIFLNDNKKTYETIDTLSMCIPQFIGWDINRAHESKKELDDRVYVTTPNNAKGLEFPFVICIANNIQNNVRFRNVLYTMLTRSYIQSYLLIADMNNTQYLIDGLSFINQKRFIETLEPSQLEKKEIKRSIILYNERISQQSYYEFLNALFDELKISNEKRKGLAEMLGKSNVERFDRDKTIEFICKMKDFI